MPRLERWTGPLSAERQALVLLDEHIEGFRRSQRMAYACAVAVGQELREGMTERDAARLMTEFLADHGVLEYFHTPFAWFGDRTTLRFHGNRSFAPSGRRLQRGDPVILDVAPVVDGHASDIGYSCSLGECPLLHQMQADLLTYRDLILDGVKKGRRRSDVYRDLDRLIETQGYENRHRRYPNRVLGHRVTWTPESERSSRTFMGFGLPTLRVVIAANVLSKLRDDFDSPEWNDAASSDRPAGPGLWAIEPHIGLLGTGAKWEELLVVTEDTAYWLDDDVPHVRRIADRSANAEAAE